MRGRRIHQQFAHMSIAIITSAYNTPFRSFTVDNNDDIAKLG